jgi:hypothetical protein
MADSPVPPKTMMPEVLPDPERRLALADGGPRARTMKHLKRLADAAKLTGPAPAAGDSGPITPE